MVTLSNVKRLYDGRSAGTGSIHEGVDVQLDGGRIAGVFPHEPAHGTSGAARGIRVDCSRFTVTPGLVDCHGHVTVIGLDAEAMARMNGPEGLLLTAKALHRSLVDGGVTTMRDVGGATHLVKRLVDEGALLGPRLKIAICMLSTTGGHADFRSRDRGHDDISRLWGVGPGRPSSLVDGPWECRKRVREIAACGADLIKICTSPGIASPGDALEHQDFSSQEIAAIVTEAEARGLRVAAHAHSRSGIELAVDCGVHDIQHVSFLDEELAARAHARGCVVTPTSWVIAALQDAPGLTPFVREKARAAEKVHRHAVRAARAAGLPILMGTDPVLPGMHGRNYLEVAHLIADGLTPLEAWHGATGLAAREIGQPDAGTLEKGQRADLLVADADIIEHPESLETALIEVLKDGVGHRGGLPALPQRTFRDTARELWPDHLGRRD